MTFAWRCISQNVSLSLSNAWLYCILNCYSILSNNISGDGTVHCSNGQGCRRKESQDRFNDTHFMAFKTTIKRSQTENQVQFKHEGGVPSSICDLCLNSGSSYLRCGTLPILTQLTKSISHGSYVTTQLLNGFCISG